MQEQQISKKKLDTIIQGGRNNADSIGISSAVLISWGFSTYSGVTIPAEVVAAMSGLIGSIAARIKK